MIPQCEQEMQNKKNTQQKIGNYKYANLNKNKTELTDKEISKARFIDCYYTVHWSSDRYMQSMRIPVYMDTVPFTDWSAVYGDTAPVGFFMASATENKLKVSPYSDDNFYLYGYSLIY